MPNSTAGHLNGSAADVARDVVLPAVQVHGKSPILSDEIIQIPLSHKSQIYPREALNSMPSARFFEF